MFYQGQPGSGSSPTQLYVVPLDPTFSAILRDVEVVNIGDADDFIQFWLVPTGESVEDQWIWRPYTRLDPGESITWEGSRNLDAGYEIWAQVVTGGLLNVIVSGMEVDETEPA